jgi:hypothetical protein
MRGLIALGLFWVSLGGGTAVAAPGGVHYDPDSPSGQEYALPLDEARNQGGGGSSGPSTEPFGEGVAPREGSSSTAPGGGHGDERADAGGQNRGGGGEQDSGQAKASDDAATAARPEVATAAVQTTAARTGLLIAAVALALAAAVGLFARHIVKRP